MARWTWAVGPASGTAPTRVLTQATGRRYTARVDAACDAQFSIRGDSDELAGFIRLAVDLWIYCDTTRIFRGRICVDQGNLDANVHTVQFSALDYRAMLNRRIIGPDGMSFPPGTDQATIAWTLISTTQAQVGGSWGITNGVGSTSTVDREATYDPGKPIGDAIGELGRLDEGFEWEISPDLAFNRWYPQRGNDVGLVLDWGGTIAQVGYGFSADDFGNAGLVTGDQTTEPVPFESDTLGTDPRGRWERAQGFPSITNQATLDARGPWYLSQIAQVRPDLRMTFRPREWSEAKQAWVGGWPGIAGCWIGDTVYPVVRNGWMQKHGTAHRIVELQIVPDGEDSEVVSVALLGTGLTDDLTAWAGTGLGGHGIPSSPVGSDSVVFDSITTDAGDPLVTESGDYIVWSG